MEDGQRPRKLQKTDDGSAITPQEGQQIPNVSTDAPEEEASEPQNEGSAAESDESGGLEERKAEGSPGASGLSKNQLKKIRRKERWEAGREFRKNKRKEKARAKRERDRALKAEQDQDTAPNNDENGEVSAQPCRRTSTKSSRGRSVLLPVTFLLDCDFDDLMTEKEIVSLSSQLTRCYSDNSKAHYRARLVIASFNEKLKERFDTALIKQYENWKGVTFTEEDFISAAEKAHSRMADSKKGGKLMGAFANQADATSAEEGEVIYLTSDSPDTLTELKPYNTYVIGGLVDRNRHKGVCYKKAKARGIKTAKLPIGDYMQMASRFVLTTNHVVDIMLKWLGLGDWGEAFDLVIPKRKGGKLKDKEEEAAEEIDEVDKEISNNDEEKEDCTVAEDPVASPERPQVNAS